MFPIIYSANGLRVPLSCAASGTLSRDNALFALTGWRSKGDSNRRCREKDFRRKTAWLLEIFRVEIRQHPAESEFAISSVGVLSSALNSGVTRFRPTNSILPRAAARGTASRVLMATKLRRRTGHVETEREHEQKTTTGQLAITCRV